MVNEIAPEMNAHCTRWGGTYNEWQSRVTQLRNFILQRCVALEQGLIDCYQLTGPFPVTFDVSPMGGGTLQVNSIVPPQYPWSTSYFGGIQTLIDATSSPGFVFSHWAVSNTATGLANSVADNYVNILAPETIVAVFVPDLPDLDNDGCHFPTAFSPDGIGDNLNENYSIIVGKDVKAFVFYVFDRWGNVMFQSSSKNLKWDGTFEGKACNSGVYAYMADVVFLDGEKKVYSGNITLIR
jgi:gliding motility-associated-like protein